MNKRRLTIFIFTCLICLSVSGSAMSLAWFSTNDYLQVDSFDIRFNVEEDLFISTKENGDYVTSLTEEDLNETTYFLPVSSMFSERWLSNKEKNPSFTGRYETRSSFNNDDPNHPYAIPYETIATNGYFSQELFLKSSGSFYATLKTDELSSFIKSNDELNRQRAKELYQSGEYRGYEEEDLYNELTRVSNAMRVSVLVDYKEKYQYYVYDPNKTEETLFGGVLDSNYSGYYDNEYNTTDKKHYEVLYGDVKNRDNLVYSYNKDDKKSLNPTSLNSGHAANTYIIDMDASLIAGVEIAKENSISFAESETIKNQLLNGSVSEEINEKLLLIPLDPNTPTRIVVSIYLEGWDKDCVNNTMGASFDWQMTFGLLDRDII